jgi:hypothetical protein
MRDYEKAFQDIINDLNPKGPKETGIEPPKIVTSTGNVMKNTFDPQFIADFQRCYQEIVHRPYDPAFPVEMGLDSNFDFYTWIVTRVKHFNESQDIIILGMRGTGKSTLGIGLAQQIQPYFDGTQFPASHICFSIDDYQALTESLSGRGGGVVVLDEVGTEGSLSSRTSMSQGNREMADVIQLMRTDRIITIYITLDAGRIDKRVRDLASIVATPIRKVPDEEMNGLGMYIEADFRHRTSKMNSKGYLEESMSMFKYAPNGEIGNIKIPHPGTTLWLEYEALRNARLKQLRESATEGSAIREVEKKKSSLNNVLPDGDDDE